MYTFNDVPGLPGYTSVPNSPSGGHPHGQKGWDNAARAAGYQDMYKNIEAMRQDAYTKEVKEGEFTPEFGHFAPTEFEGMGQFKPNFTVCKSEGGTANCPSEYVKEFGGFGQTSGTSYLCIAIAFTAGLAVMYFAAKKKFITV